ncbi:efflux RND transporter periplasmic adaptor subunit [Henriciella aquimarina]|uniref:efflux RND transporter periplasmic adaptor subunit n=1 Tax=Henriciella aquimarina TaxID=545261 RepID=UPI000A020C9D|nr:efflux RND transporter periplasmic adaptor subunit [Henriciella aquimarina]
MSDTANETRPKKSRGIIFQVFSILVTIIVLTIVLGGLFFWRNQTTAPQQAPQQQALPVSATQVQPQEVPVSLEAVGTLKAVDEVVLSAEVAGRVTRTNFESGLEVEKGDLLVQLYDAPERADLEAALARLDLAKTQLARSEELAPKGAEPKEVLEQRRAEHDQAVAAIRQLEARLRQKQVRAPFSGRMGIRRINLGQYLNPGEPIASLTALDQLYVEFSLPQQQLSRITAGSEVHVLSDAFPERDFAATVNAVEPQIAEDTRNVAIEALLPNPDGLLRPGMYVTASLELPPQKGALVVPATAVQTSAQGNSIVIIEGDNARSGGTAKIVPVQAGRRIGNNIVITSGLEPGDVIVTDGQLRIQPGAPLKVADQIASGGK